MAIASDGQPSRASRKLASLSAGTGSAFTTATSLTISKTAGHAVSHRLHPMHVSLFTVAFMLHSPFAFTNKDGKACPPLIGIKVSEYLNAVNAEVPFAAFSTFFGWGCGKKRKIPDKTSVLSGIKMVGQAGVEPATPRLGI